MALLECIPNVSEGCRPAVIERFASRIAGTGARLLDHSSDPDHHRSVFTLAGEADALIEAMLGLYEGALDEIDLRHHHGVHPRVGAVDVTPFVPLAGTPMTAAVAAAHQLGERVAERFGLPVFFYEEAFRRDADQALERRNLAEVRRGGILGLAARMEQDSAWRPDAGPPRPHPTGGTTVIGARFFLIAFNAVLASTDVTLARRIARQIRHSSGGLPALKAIGVALGERAGGRAQVSMNLVDYRSTSLPQALEAVQRAAKALGTSVHETEIIGLVPRAAAQGVTAEELLLRTPLPILEDRLSV